MMTQGDYMKKTLTILFTAALMMVTTVTFADPFNKRLKPEEREKLEKGEVVIRNTGDIDKICMNKNEATTKMIEVIDDLDPAYLAEIIQIRPYEGNEDLLERTMAVLMDIQEYTHIPFRARAGDYMLYNSAEITEEVTEGNSKKILADMDMDPFGLIKTQIDIDENESSVFFQMMNLNQLRYRDQYNAVKPQKMKSVITVFRDGDNWVLYALGSVDTFKIFFLKDRVETSFMNRIKTFCNFIFTKI